MTSMLTQVMGGSTYLDRREGLVLLVLQLAGRLGLSDQVWLCFLFDSTIKFQEARCRALAG